AVVVQAAQVWSGMGPKLRKEISRGGLIFCGEDEQWSGGIQLELRESNLECGAHEFKVLKHMLRFVNIAVRNQAKVGARISVHGRFFASRDGPESRKLTNKASAHAIRMRSILL